MYTVGHIPFAVGLDGVIAGGMDEIAHVEELAWELVDFDRNKVLPAKEWYLISKKVFYLQYKPLFHLRNCRKLETQYRDRAIQTVKKLENSAIRVNTTLYLDEVIIQKLFAPKSFKTSDECHLSQNYTNSVLKGTEKHQVMFKGGKDLAPFKYAIDKMLLVAAASSRHPFDPGN